jgi:hypothetical protein
MARRFVIAAASTVALLACGESLGPIQSFATSWSQWNRLRPAQYTYDFRRGCFCGGEAVQPVRITVSNGQVVSVRHLPDLTPVPPEQVSQFYQVTLDSVFAIVRHAIATDADMISAQYDPRWGYPSDVMIDYRRNAADEELSVTTTLQSP